MNVWRLPDSLSIGGREIKIRPDFRNILRIIELMNRDLPPLILWQAAEKLFYDERIQPEHMAEAAEKLSEFISMGREEKPGPKLIDWEQDAGPIIADVNRAAGFEVRSVPFLHWWTFLSFFNSIGEGQLSTIVSIRNKKAKHQKLDQWEQEFYSENRSEIDFKTKYTEEEQKEIDRLNKLLDGK